jgi:hypothetical protein
MTPQQGDPQMEERNRLEETGVYGRRYEDDRRAEVSAERLSFPLKVVISLMGSALAVCVFILSITWELRSDIRDINTKLGAADQIQGERLSNIREQLGSIRRMQDLQNYEVQALKLSLSEAGIKIRYPKE